MDFTSSLAFRAARESLSSYMIRKAHRAAQDIGFSYEPAEDAPNDYESLILAVNNSLRTLQPLKVFSGASGSTIYTSAEANYAFRFCHDLFHFIHKADFSISGEARTIEKQAEDVAKTFGKSSLEYKLLVADALGQVAYHAIHSDFPVDQLSFVVAAIQTH